MNHKTGRNEACPCGSGKKYKKCCMQHAQKQDTNSQSWVDEEGIHLLSRGTPPSLEEQKRMTEEYQKQIKKSPMWKMMLEKYGEDRANEMLKEFQVQVKS